MILLSSAMGHRMYGAKARAQRGAALFTALMVLIILSILGIASARVTALQERMAGVYLADMRAFQAAEDQLRDLERFILAAGPEEVCFNEPEAGVGAGAAGEWVGNDSIIVARDAIENLNHPQSSAARGLAVGSSRQVRGLETGGAGCLFFRVSSLDFDNAAGRTSRSIVQSSFVP